MNKCDLVVGKGYYSIRNCRVYRYEGVHASTLISTVHKFTEFIEVFDVDFNVIGLIEETLYIDSKRDGQFIEELCIFF